MTLRAQLTASLANTTSKTAISTSDLAKGRAKRRVHDELLAMYARREIGCCKCFKGDDKPVDVWWMVGNVSNEPMHRGRKPKAAKQVEVVEDE